MQTIIRPSRRPYTPADLEFIRANYAHLTCQQIAQHLGRSRSCIAHYLSQAGLSRGSKKPFSAQDKAYMQANYRTQSNNEMAAVLGRSASVVSDWVARLGLVRSSEEVYNLRARRAARISASQKRRHKPAPVAAAAAPAPPAPAVKAPESPEAEAARLARKRLLAIQRFEKGWSRPGCQPFAWLTERTQSPSAPGATAQHSVKTHPHPAR